MLLSLRGVAAAPRLAGASSAACVPRTMACAACAPARPAQALAHHSDHRHIWSWLFAVARRVLILFPTRCWSKTLCRDDAGFLKYVSLHAEEVAQVLNASVLRPQRLLDEASKLAVGEERASYFARQQQAWHQHRNAPPLSTQAESVSRHNFLSQAVEPEMQRQVDPLCVYCSSE